jgi:hypothetical protein
MVSVARIAALLLVITLGSDAHAQRGRDVRPHPDTHKKETKRFELDMSRSREQARVSDIRSRGKAVETEFVTGGDSTREWVKKYLAKLSPEDFSVHLSGSMPHEIELLELKAKGDLLYEYYQHLRKTGTSGDRALYARVLDERGMRYRTKWLDNQGPHVTSQLHRFIEDRIGPAPISRETELAYVGKFLDSLAVSRSKLLLEFPNAGRLDHPLSYEAATSVEAATTWPKHHDVRRLGLEAYIQRSPMLRALRIKTWRFKNAGLDEISRIVMAMDATLPGGQPEVMYFFDRAVAIGATAEMTKAWTSRGRTEPMFLDHSDINQLMDGMSGKTLLLIGHIENESFVMERGGALPPLILNIPDAIRAAEARKVFFLPIGCESAKAGAYYGFQRPISTSEVAKLLQAIPGGRLKVGDVLAGFAALGDVFADVTKLHRFLEIVVHKKEALYNEEAKPVSVIRIPSAVGAPTDVDEFLSEWAFAHLSWYDKGRLAPIGAAIRANSSFITLVVGALLLLLSAFFGAIQRQRAHLRRWSKAIRAARSAALVVGVALVGLALLSMSILIGIGAATLALFCFWARIARESI